LNFSRMASVDMRAVAPAFTPETRAQ
jgi:hypothetical protein